jgi:hypothetical protein
MSETLVALAQRLRSLEPLLAQYVTDPPAISTLPTAPLLDNQHELRSCVRGQVDRYKFILEAVYEGYLLHYKTGRIVQSDERDFAVLAGDRLYALALATLTQCADVYGVSVLAQLIAELAQFEITAQSQQVTAAWKKASMRLFFSESETQL